jgi:hypothetical protein
MSVSESSWEDDDKELDELELEDSDETLFVRGAVFTSFLFIFSSFCFSSLEELSLVTKCRSLTESYLNAVIE